jgi:hypothetical protein
VVGTSRCDVRAAFSGAIPVGRVTPCAPFSFSLGETCAVWETAQGIWRSQRPRGRASGRERVNTEVRASLKTQSTSAPQVGTSRCSAWRDPRRACRVEAWRSLACRVEAERRPVQRRNRHALCTSRLALVVRPSAFNCPGSARASRALLCASRSRSAPQPTMHQPLSSESRPIDVELGTWNVERGTSPLGAANPAQSGRRRLPHLCPPVPHGGIRAIRGLPCEARRSTG